jgi:hypothetical protein
MGNHHHPAVRYSHQHQVEIGKGKMLSQEHYDTIVSALEEYAHVREAHYDGLPAALADAKVARQAMAALQALRQPQPLDFPDGVGYWAFDGVRRVNWGEQPKRKLFDIAIYTDVLDEQDAPYPAFVLAGEPHLWHGKYYPNPPEGIGGLQFIGKWYKLTMPWQAQEGDR